MLRLLLLILFLLAPALAEEADDPIVGRWRWWTGNIIILDNEHHLMFGDKEFGSWTLVSAGPPRHYRLEWNLSTGRDVDTLTLTEDGLEGTNQAGIAVSGEKLPNRVWREDR